MEYFFAFGIVRGEIAQQHQPRIDLLAREFERLYHALGIFPWIEARNLYNQGEISWNLIVRKPFVDFLVAEFSVFDVEGIDRGHDHPMGRLHFMGKFLTAKNHYVVAIDPTPQIFPCPGVWLREIEMAAPDPGTLLFVMLDQRKWLRIVHDHKVVLQEIAKAVFINHLFENFPFDARQIDLCALERVVHFLCDREEIGRALNHAPFGAQTEAVPKQRERRKCFGHATAVVGRIEIRHAQSLEQARLLANALDIFSSNEQLVIFELSNAIMRHSL